MTLQRDMNHNIKILKAIRRGIAQSGEKDSARARSADRLSVFGHGAWRSPMFPEVSNAYVKYKGAKYSASYRTPCTPFPALTVLHYYSTKNPFVMQEEAIRHIRFS